jgi:hypothetical protein
MSNSREWANLSLLERNQMFIDKRNAKLNKERKNKAHQELAE